MAKHPSRRFSSLLLPLSAAAALAVGSAPWPAANAVDSPVTIMGAGDIAASSTLANAKATGDLIRAANPNAVFTVGDNAYPSGRSSDYTNYYEPTWGSFKAKAHPTPGNHEYASDPLVGYAGYFGRANVTNSSNGGLYYGWDVGNGWRAYAVNTEISTSGAQLTWLKNDLAAHPGMRYILYTHRPRYTSGVYDPSTAVCPLWDALASTGRLEIVMAGHDHHYERFAEMDCAGRQTTAGARSFVVGSGGGSLYSFGTPEPGSQFRNSTDYGVLKLVLHDTYYEWSFVASGRGAGGSTGNTGKVLDSGTQATNGSASPGNAAPSVNAGVDRTVTLPASANLDGTVTDDGLPNPPATVTTAWSKASGPGTVTFSNTGAVDTTATFSAAGTYVLRLTASDSAASASDTVTVTVQAAAGTVTTRTVDVRVAAGNDDAEQQVSNGYMYRSSSDLELTTDGSIQQVVGTRFAGVQVPRGATVTSAWVQFRTDEASTSTTSLTIRAENADNAATYTSTTGSMTARPTTTASVSWAPPGWSTVGATGTAQRTPNIAGLVQAVVNRAGWTSGNAIALQFRGTGRRTAESYEGLPSYAPLLHIEYQAPQ